MPSVRAAFEAIGQQQAALAQAGESTLHGGGALSGLNLEGTLGSGGGTVQDKALARLKEAQAAAAAGERTAAEEIRVLAMGLSAGANRVKEILKFRDSISSIEQIMALMEKTSEQMTAFPDWALAAGGDVPAEAAMQLLHG